jgi:hypothetical protein
MRPPPVREEAVVPGAKRNVGSVRMKGGAVMRRKGVAELKRLRGRPTLPPRRCHAGRNPDALSCIGSRGEAWGE